MSLAHVRFDHHHCLGPHATTQPRRSDFDSIGHWHGDASYDDEGDGGSWHPHGVATTRTTTATAVSHTNYYYNHHFPDNSSCNHDGVTTMALATTTWPRQRGRWRAANNCCRHHNDGCDPDANDDTDADADACADDDVDVADDTDDDDTDDDDTDADDDVKFRAVPKRARVFTIILIPLGSVATLYM
ncbi:hypothetical protein EDB89DRAFT_1915363 [Lactarius sanguifluus]|nr:hypothetical protein EDB89DRAFT_1915363 [Lactarius sanguifluus]